LAFEPILGHFVLNVREQVCLFHPAFASLGIFCVNVLA
jgi:hypothetical protein